MATSTVISQTVQGALLSATSNILAQVVSSYKDDKPFSIDFSPILKFIIFSIISGPPNILWQMYLEELFPNEVPVSNTTPSEKKPHQPNGDAGGVKKTRTSTRNIAIKFLLDQTIGALFNNLMFLSFIGYTSAQDKGEDAWTSIARTVREKLVPMAIDGYKFWPLVSLAAFVWVPVEKRVLFGGAAGLLWGIYLSLMVQG
ncbi:hypothetical protein DM02DRAFT_620156 [Periconia macrospinosa]|uniref:Integral membrane protein-like protein n=1 Tax=Periconia macrospinosa TaxID=97972 RepID=A0A2V1D204_9PLEO|nr:hypothetical protein DM02DRAFT_620156 [Periconia macrospinosa]